MGAPPINDHAQGMSPARRWLALAGVCMGVLVGTIDFSVVNVSLPTLMRELDTDFVAAQWVVLAYVLVVTSLMLGAGRLGDMYGERRLYAGGMLVFILGSALCGLAPGVGWLITFRGFQGLGAVFMQALGVAIVARLFPAGQRGKALGVVGTVVSVGLVLGPALGGVLIGHWGWRSVFLVNVPLGLAALVVVLGTVPQRATRAGSGRFDGLGALVLFLTLCAYSLGLTLGQQTGFVRPGALALLGAAVVGLWAFIRLERRRPAPMLDLTLFSRRLLTLNLMMSFLIFVSLGLTLVLPFYLELVMGLSTSQTGLMMMVVPLAMGLVAPWAGWLSDRWGPRGISIVGLLMMAAGDVAMITVHPGVGAMGFAMRLLPIGLGLGLFQPSNNNAILGESPPNRIGVVSGLMALARTLGNFSGVPVAGALFTWVVLSSAGLGPDGELGRAGAEALARGVAGTYVFAAAVALAAAGLGWAAWARAGGKLDNRGGPG